MINMKAMTTLQKIGRGFREIHRLEPQLIPLTLTSGVTKAALPFVNLYFSSRIIDILSTTREMKTLILFVALALAINLFLFITSRTLENRYYMSRGLLYNKERGEVIRKLYTLDYEKLESPAFQTLLHKHQEAMDKAGSSLYRLSWMLSHWVSGATTLAFALVLLFPLLKISFKGGETFVESPWFAVALFAAIGVAVGIILIISRKISKEWFRLSEQYMGLDRLYDYYTEMIADYKTGKEIRTYQEQLIIEKDATQQLLNEGIAIQKKNRRQQRQIQLPDRNHRRGDRLRHLPFYRAQGAHRPIQHWQPRMLYGQLHAGGAGRYRHCKHHRANPADYPHTRLLF